MKKPKVGEKVKLPGFGMGKITEVDRTCNIVGIKRGRHTFAATFEFLEVLRLQTWCSDGKEAIRADGWSRHGYRGRKCPQWKRVWVKSPWAVIHCQIAEAVVQ